MDQPNVADGGGGGRGREEQRRDEDGDGGGGNYGRAENDNNNLLMEVADNNNNNNNGLIRDLFGAGNNNNDDNNNNDGNNDGINDGNNDDNDNNPNNNNINNNNNNNNNNNIDNNIDNNNNNNNNGLGEGVLDGGVAIGVISSNNNNNNNEIGINNGRGSALNCDLVLLIEYVESENDDDSSNNESSNRSKWNGPKSGVAVAIGLEKTTKLSAVFAAYVQFCNRMYQNNNETSDLEFYHCQVLRGSDTAEASALMKNDRLYCRSSTKYNHRQMEAERLREQRESDRKYLEKMRQLLEISSSTSQLWLHCIGKCKDERGLHQQVLTPYVRAHPALLHKRCPWLSAKITLSSLTNNTNHAQHYNHLSYNTSNSNHNNLIPYPYYSNNYNSNVKSDDNNNRHRNNNNNGNNKNIDNEMDAGGHARVPDGADEEDDRKRSGDETDCDEDDVNVIRPLPPSNNHPNEIVAAGRNNNYNPNPARAAEVEDDEEEEHSFHSKQRNNNNNNRNNNFADYSNNAINRIAIPPEDIHQHSLMDGIYQNKNNNTSSYKKKIVYVTLDHPPEAVKLLLEYCYTNRVVPLGRLAFKESCKSPDPCTTDPAFLPFLGPVPFPKNLVPNPTISFAVALAGIRLAEEAMMPRLSLMCEVAASQLVSQSTVLAALAICATQEKETGNCLPRLRKAAMLQHIFYDGKRGIDKLEAIPSFRRTLEDQSDLVVPSLLMGTYEVMKEILTQGPTSGGELHYDSRVLAALFGIANNSSSNNGRKDSKKKGNSNHNNRNDNSIFAQIDHKDALERAKERYNRRNERWDKRPRHENKNPYSLEDALDAEFLLNNNNSNESSNNTNNSSIIVNDDNLMQEAMFGRIFGSNINNNGGSNSGTRSNRRSFNESARLGSHLRLISSNSRNSILLGGGSGRTSGVRSRKRRSHNSSSNHNYRGSGNG